MATFVAVNRNTVYVSLWYLQPLKIHNFILDIHSHTHTPTHTCTSTYIGCILKWLAQWIQCEMRLEFHLQATTRVADAYLCNVWSGKDTLFFSLICLSESGKRLPTTKDLCRSTHCTMHITINLIQILHTM